MLSKKKTKKKSVLNSNVESNYSRNLTEGTEKLFKLIKWRFLIIRGSNLMLGDFYAPIGITELQSEPLKYLLSFLLYAAGKNHYLYPENWPVLCAR